MKADHFAQLLHRPAAGGRRVPRMRYARAGAPLHARPSLHLPNGRFPDQRPRAHPDNRPFVRPAALTRPAVGRLASAIALLTGGLVAGTGTAAADTPVTDVCGGCPQYPFFGSEAVQSSAEALTAATNPVLLALTSLYNSVVHNSDSPSGS